MRTVYNKKELKNALKAGEKHILCKGEIARTFIRRRKMRKGATVAGILAGVGCFAAAPFTFGSSLGIGAGFIATGLTAGSLTMSAGELAIICGTFLAALGIGMRCKVHCGYNSDGSVELNVEP